MPTQFATSHVRFTRPATRIQVQGAVYEPTDVLLCKDIGVAKAEVNANQDDISPENIDELVATLALKPISLEHRMGKMVGVITASRKSTSRDGKPQARMDFLAYTRHTPDDVIEGMLNGEYGVSVEADPLQVICSKCGQTFDFENDYCEHIATVSAKRRLGAKRSFRHLTGTGAAIVRKPAGTETEIPSHSVSFIASMEDDMQKCAKCGNDCGDGSKELKGSLYCGTCAPGMEASLTAEAEKPHAEPDADDNGGKPDNDADDKDKVPPAKASVDLSTLEAGITKLGDDLRTLIATVQERVVALEGNLTPKLTAAAQQTEELSSELKTAKLKYRKAKLVDSHLLTAAEFDAQENALLSAPDEFIEFMAAKLAAKPTRSEKPRMIALQMSAGMDEAEAAPQQTQPAKLVLKAG